jgi:hypothetical protein
LVHVLDDGRRLPDIVTPIHLSLSLSLRLMVRFVFRRCSSEANIQIVNFIITQDGRNVFT